MDIESQISSVLSIQQQPMPTLIIAKSIFGVNARAKDVNPHLYRMEKKGLVNKYCEEGGKNPRWVLSRGIPNMDSLTTQMSATSLGSNPSPPTSPILPLTMTNFHGVPIPNYNPSVATSTFVPSPTLVNVPIPNSMIRVKPPSSIVLSPPVIHGTTGTIHNEEIDDLSLRILSLFVQSNQTMTAIEIANAVYGPGVSTTQINPTLYKMKSTGLLQYVTEQGKVKPHWYKVV